MPDTPAPPHVRPAAVGGSELNGATFKFDARASESQQGRALLGGHAPGKIRRIWAGEGGRGRCSAKEALYRGHAKKVKFLLFEVRASANLSRVACRPYCLPSTPAAGATAARSLSPAQCYYRLYTLKLDSGYGNDFLSLLSARSVCTGDPPTEVFSFAPSPPPRHAPPRPQSETS